jgi:hypothetical protein
MDEIREEFENYADELRTEMQAGALAGTDGTRARDALEGLIVEYRERLEAESSRSRARELLERFRAEAARL